MTDRILGVDVDFIDAFNEAARSTYPDEFLCMVREIDGVISEMVLLPGTVYGDSHSFLNQWMAPIDYSLAGSAHSHPGYSNRPSEADKDFFRNTGGVHFITCLPYDRTSWRAYDSRGEPVDLEIVYRRRSCLSTPSTTSSAIFMRPARYARSRDSPMISMTAPCSSSSLWRIRNHPWSSVCLNALP